MGQPKELEIESDGGTEPCAEDEEPVEDGEKDEKDDTVEKDDKEEVDQKAIDRADWKAAQNRLHMAIKKIRSRRF